MGMQYSRGLVAGYPFENTANDILGVNNGTVYGATYVDGQSGRALSFDGVDDYVVANNNYNFTAGIISISFRFLYTSKQMYPRMLNISDATNSIQILIDTRQAPSGVVSKNTKYQSGYSSTRWADIPPQNVYRHYVGIFNNVTNTEEFYINCVKMTGVSGPIVGAVGATSKIHMGVRLDLLSTTFLKGIIDNFQIFNRALTVNEIKRLYLNLGI